MAQYLDADDLFLITKQGFDFFHEQFGVRYPLPKYDQLWVPDFNAGAMENFGCVTHAEAHYIFRSQVTDYEYEQRANTILHELAHMWFGDLVTMRWWNDLWLNESFAEWASHWCNTSATRFTDAWTTFLSIRKTWGYRQDQLSSTHPVYCEMPDLEAVEVNFDGITYAKGASVIKQLVAYVGLDPFLAGLRAYFQRARLGQRHLRRPAHRAGDGVRPGAAQVRRAVAGDRAGQHAAPGGRDRRRRHATTSVVVQQEAPAGLPDAAHPPDRRRPLRPRRRPAGAARAARGGRDRRADRDPRAGRGAGRRRAAAQRRRPDLREAAAGRAVDGHGGASTSPASTRRCRGRCAGRPPGTCCATPSWPPATTWRWSAPGLPAETRHQPDHRHAAAGRRRALTMYADPAWAPTGWAQLADTARDALAAAEPGSGFQLAWARAFVTAARADERPGRAARLAGRRRRAGRPDRSTPSCAGRCCRRWPRWARPTEAEIDDELAGDRTASGEREAALARALLPTAENKAAGLGRADRRRRSCRTGCNRSLLQGFQSTRRRWR